MPEAKKSQPVEPEASQERSVTIGGNVDGSVVVSGNQNVIYVNGMPVALPASEGEASHPLRVLTVVARPLNTSELPEIADAWSLTDGLLAVEAPVEARFVRPPTVRQWEAEIDGGCDILHFDGHGTAEEGGFLLFETEDGLAEALPADEFIRKLQKAGQPPKLILLSACQSARGEKGGLAGRIAREAKIPAVIGFSESVPVNVTMIFVKRLYAALGAGRPVKEAFEAARLALGEMTVSLPPEKQGAPARTLRAADLPVLTGKGIGEPLCQAQRGRPQVEREPLVGVPSPSESGRFYGVFDARSDPPAGRKALLVRAARALLDGQKFVVLTGVGGIGKTALAAALARRLAWRFPGGVFWVNGADYIESGLSLDDALAPFAAAFGQDFLKLPTAQKRQAVLTYFERMEAPALWVVDNADAAAEDVWRMARQVPGRSAALLTSRERPEYGGCVISLDGMAEAESLLFLLEETARRQNRPLAWDKASFQTWVEIASLLDGHALALMHAAALIAEEGLEAALKAMRANPARGDTARRFDFSYGRLTADEKRLLHRLAVFAADFDTRAVEAVCTVPLDEQDQDLLPGWEEGLRALARKSFVEVRFWSADHRRYRLHPVLREYVRGRPHPISPLLMGEGARPAPSEVEGVRDTWRMVQYYLALAGAARDLLGDTENALTAVRFAEIERLNLLAAQETCLVQGKYQEVLQYMYTLDALFDRSGYWHDRNRVLETGLKASKNMDDQHITARILGQIGNAAYQQGNYPEARSRYQEILEIFRNSDDKDGESITLHQLGVLAQATGDYAGARRLYDESLNIKEQLGDKAGVASTLHQLGNIAYLQGDYAEARRLYTESLNTLEQLGDKDGVARSLHQLGMLAQATGDYAEARRLYAESLNIAEQLGNKAAMANSLHQLGNVAYLQDYTTEARRLYAESLNILEQLGDKAGVARSLHQLGMLAQDTGDYAEARRLYAESLNIKEQLGDKAGAALSKAQLSLLEEQEGNLSQALALIREAEAVFASLGAPQREQARQVRERIEGKLNTSK